MSKRDSLMFFCLSPIDSLFISVHVSSSLYLALFPKISIMAQRKCINSPDKFCYICGELTVLKQQVNITDFVKKVYFAYFGLKIGDQDKAWAPHKVCRRCVEDLRNLFIDKKTAFRFGIPMVWREQKNHNDDCYFCTCNVKGYNSK